MSPLGSDEPLRQALERCRSAGAIGPVPIDDVLAHSLLFVEALAGVTGRVIDLGSGGGVPGLVIAWHRPDLDLVLVDRRAKRTDLLRRACSALGMTARVDVFTGEAESVPGDAHAVVARLFAAPEVTARISSSLVRSGGLVVVSDAPAGHPWDSTAVAGWSRAVIERPVGRVLSFTAP